MVYAYATDGQRIWSFQSKRDRDEWVDSGRDKGRRLLTDYERKKHNNARRRVGRGRVYGRYDPMGV